MSDDLAHKRPWLLLSLFFGIGYMLPIVQSLPGAYLVAWKMAAAAFLVPYVLRRHNAGDFVTLGCFLALCSIGDGLIEFSLEAGGAAFGLAHIVAIWLFSRHRRLNISVSQKALALTIFIATPIIAYGLAGKLPAVYALLLSTMAAMAWSSNFPRYRVGIGAVLFVISDLLIFARQAGHFSDLPVADYIIWYGYYTALLLIAIGVTQTMMKRDYAPPPSGVSGSSA